MATLNAAKVAPAETVSDLRKSDQSGNAISRLGTLSNLENQDERERSLDVLRLAYREARHSRDLAIEDMAEIKALANEIVVGRMAATFAIARVVQLGLIVPAYDEALS